MAGRRRGWFRASGTAQNNEWVQQARQALTTAFLDMDKRQSIAEAAVAASAALFPERGMAARWDVVRARCYGASGAYLALNDRLDQAERDGTRIAQPEIDSVVRGLTEAAGGVDQFYRGNQAHLEHAVAVYGSVPQLIAQVRAQGQQQLAAVAASPYAEYPSVRHATAAVNEGLVTLEAAVSAGSGRSGRDAATRLETLLRELSTALEAAPAKQHSATTAIASAATRLDAARNRVERVAPAMSGLLREFAAASSNDLANNERQAREAVAAADADLTRARAALAANDPEDALDLTSTARAQLATAEERAETVTDRLALLRQVRDQPADRAKAVRFKLRDAQMLAVNKGVVPQWGSVLDAQSERLERAAAGLTGHHPDYWAYVSELDAISAFVAGVVDRMRNTDR
ncbi:hypothetical protein ACFXHA_20370 [Nocardia sp. NPDC059240]|uniref:hypothetical protein n=1 Tax=Nocardia sp. NPDC059240 TaxID=3346786 RepID=UPI0036B8A91B